MIDQVRRLTLAVVFLCAAACTTLQSAREPAPARVSLVTLLVFGNRGCHYDYLEKEDYGAVVTEAQFRAKERQDWIEDKRPIEELDFPPLYKLPRNGSIMVLPAAKVYRSARPHSPTRSAIQTALGTRPILRWHIGDRASLAHFAEVRHGLSA